MVDIKKFSEINLYELFGITIDATESEVSLTIFIKNQIKLI